MSIKVITAATAEPLSVSEVKDYLRVDSSAEDALVGVLIAAARTMCEQYTRQILMTTTIEEYWDDFPASSASAPREASGQWFTEYDILRLSRGPVQSVTSVKYYDGNGVEQTINSSSYSLDSVSEPARILPVTAWEGIDPNRLNSVIVRYVVGYASAAAVPAPLKQAMLLMVGDMYEKRQDSVKQMPSASEYLMNPFRVFEF